MIFLLKKISESQEKKKGTEQKATIEDQCDGKII